MRAARELVEVHGSANKAAKATGLVQQTLSELLRNRTLGLEFADKIAALYETTIDGLVWKFVRGGEGKVRAGDVPGWSRSVEEAKSAWGDMYPYGIAAETHLPIAPRVATPEFARDLAVLYYNHTRSSSVRAAVRKAGS